MNISLKDMSEKPPLIMGHYLPWFIGEQVDAFLPEKEMIQGNLIPELDAWRHWRDSRSLYQRTHLHQPLWGEYDSRDPVIIRRQIMLAKEYGLDGFIINLYGKNSVENLIGLFFLEELKKYNAVHKDDPFLFCVSFDAQAQWPTEGKVPVSLEEDFQYLKDVWFTDYYVHVDEKPVLLVFPYEKTCLEYRQAVDQVFGGGRVDIVWSGTNDAGQNAAYPWVKPSSVDEYGRWLNPDDAGDRELKQFYTDCQLNSEINYLVGGIWPGFNDQLVRWAWNDQERDPNTRPRLICRETTRGNTLKLTWQTTLEYLQNHWQGKTNAHLGMPMIQLITWNDWAESSQIEPDRDSGFKALDICNEFITQIKNYRKEVLNHEEDHLLIDGNLCLQC